MTSGAAPKPSPNYQVRALQRGLALLRCFTPQQPALALHQLAQAAGLDKATALRLLAVLEHEGYVEREAERGLYRLGIRAFDLARAYLGGQRLVSVAEPFIRELAEVCGQTCELGARDGQEVVTLYASFPRRLLRLHTSIGARYPYYCCSIGKALVAHLPDDQLDALIRVTELRQVCLNTITDPALLREELLQTRARGYALDFEEAAPGVYCVGAPLRDDTGQAVAAISVSGPKGEFAGEQLWRYVALVMEAAREISARLGYTGAWPVAPAAVAEVEKQPA